MPERELDIDHLMPDIARRSLRGVAVTFGAQAVKVALQFAAVIVLARLLPPAAFGLVAMVASINATLDLVKELGLSAATIQKPDITHAQVSALFWINAAAGALIAAALYAAAPLIAAFYGEPGLVPVARWLALGFVVSGLTVQHWALLRRQMRFGAIAAVETGGEIVGLVVAIVLAMRGAGYWALVAQRLTGPMLALIGSWCLCRWRPGPPARAAGTGALVRFGASVTAYMVAGVFTRNIDQILVGWLWGPAWLGLYERAARLLLIPINTVNAPIYAVAMPAFCRLAGEHARYRAAFKGLIEKLAMLTMPAGALVWVTSDWVVAILFGERWSAAVPVLAAFGIAVAWLPVTLAVALLYLTQDRPREMSRAALLDAALCIVTIAAGTPFGPTGVAASYAVGGLLLRLPAAFALATRRGPVVASDLVAAVLPSVVTAACVAGAILLLRDLAGRAIHTPAGALTLATFAALATAALAFAAMPQSRRTLATLVRLARAMRRPEVEAGAARD